MKIPFVPYKKLSASHKRQGGVVTLIVSLVILTLSTLVVFNVSKAILMEQKITNNDNREKQAFEAAEAGMSVTLNQLNADPDSDADGCIGPFFDNDADGILEAFSTTVGVASVTVEFPDPDVVPGCDAVAASFNVRSTGWSDDRTAMRVITQTAIILDPLPNRPDNPLTVQGGVTISGSASVYNQEGFSTIWSGNPVVLGGAGSGTYVPNPNATTGPNAYPSCIDVSETCSYVSTSLNVGLGLDVIENDDSLGDLTQLQFFINFFGTTPENYRASMVTRDIIPTAANIAALDTATSEVIWIQGNAAFTSQTVGCTVHMTGINKCLPANTRPSIVIVNGNATFNGTPQFYGLLFVMGNATMTANMTVHGAAVVQGNTVSTSGSLDIFYNGNLLQQTALNGTTAGGAGSWKDWD